MQFMFNLSNMAALSLGVQSSLPSAACGIELPLMCACCSFVSGSCHDGPFVVHLLCDRALCVCVCVLCSVSISCVNMHIYTAYLVHTAEKRVLFFPRRKITRNTCESVCCVVVVTFFPYFLLFCSYILHKHPPRHLALFKW